MEDNRTEDQKRLARIEEEVIRLREMVMLLLQPENKEYFRDQLRAQYQSAAKSMFQSRQS